MMAFIKIEISENFPVNIKGKRMFYAKHHGHAHAISDAIAFLSNKVLREAINYDHELHEEGEKPNKGFTK